MTAKTREAIIRKYVQDYFKQFPLETFAGLVHTDEVLQAVLDTLHTEWQTKTSAKDHGIVYDAIREFGPVGEDDRKWLLMWSRDTFPWPEEAALIDGWGMLA